MLDYLEKNGLLKKLLEDAREAIWILDPKGVTLYVNARMAEILECTPDEIVGQLFTQFIPPENVESALARLSRRMAGERSDVETHLKKKSGELILVFTSANPIYDDQGAVIGSVAFVTDISKRQAADSELSKLSKSLEKLVQEREADLKRSQRELQSFFESSPLLMGIVELFGEDLKHVIDNPSFCKFVGIKPGESAGRMSSSFGGTAEALRDWIVHCRVSQKKLEPIQHDFVLTTAEQSRYFSCYTNFIGLSPVGNPRFSYVSEEITEKKELERKKDENATKITHLSKMSALGEMASGIAHEIYNPLTIIRGYADLIARKSTQGTIDPNELNQIVQEIKGTCKRIGGIIEGLRFFAREGSQDPMEMVLIETLVDSTTKICSERFKRMGVLLEVVHQDPGLKVSCRGVQISQVILNLLNNSFDAVQNQEFKKISIETKFDQFNAYIEIKDNGPGIEENIRGKVFEPFFTTKPVDVGTGMGLSISKGIMESHNGSIRLNSSSQGTCFQLELPHGTA